MSRVTSRISLYLRVVLESPFLFLCIFKCEVENCPYKVCDKFCFCFMEIILNLQIAIGKIGCFTVFLLLICEHGTAFHLLLSSSILVAAILKILSFKSFTFLVSVTPGSIIWTYCERCCLFLFLSLSFLHMRIIDFCEFVFIQIFCRNCLLATRHPWQILSQLFILSYHLKIRHFTFCILIFIHLCSVVLLL